VCWCILTASENDALQCNSRRAGPLILLQKRVMFGEAPRNSIQTNLSLWWLLTFHLFFPPPRLFASRLRFGVVGGSCIWVALTKNRSSRTTLFPK